MINFKPSFISAGYGSEESLNSLPGLGDRVTIATGDDLCLSVDQFYYTIGLKDESKSDSTCVFRKRILETKQIGTGRVETVVFVLDCDQDFYLTTNKQKELELNVSILFKVTCIAAHITVSYNSEANLK